MGDFLQLATMTGMVLGAGLGVRLLAARAWKWQPCFVLLIGVLAVTSGLEFVFSYTHNFTAQEYSRLYWKLTSLEAALSLAALGECFDCRKMGAGLGVTLGIGLGLLGSPLGFAAAGTTLTLISLAGCWRKQSRLAAGMACFWLPWSLIFLPSVPFWARGIPVFSWVVACLFWFFVPVVTDDLVPSY